MERKITMGRYEFHNEKSEGRDNQFHDINMSKSSLIFDESRGSESTNRYDKTNKNCIFSIEEVRAIFDVLDIDHLGRISKDDLKKAVKFAEENASEEEIEVTFQHLDKDEDGWISFEDFYSMINE